MKSCASCIFFHVRRYSVSLHCRRYPPAYYTTTYSGEITSFLSQPQVKETDWCGEYQEKRSDIESYIIDSDGKETKS
jgi:hypothetical protein